MIRADGEAIPTPRSFEELRRESGFAEDAADAIVTIVSPQKVREQA